MKSKRRYFTYTYNVPTTPPLYSYIRTEDYLWHEKYREVSWYIAPVNGIIPVLMISWLRAKTKLPCLQRK
jgi:hypothetical protein